MGPIGNFLGCLASIRTTNVLSLQRVESGETLTATKLYEAMLPETYMEIVNITPHNLALPLYDYEV
jgi:hypothetical protein